SKIAAWRTASISAGAKAARSAAASSASTRGSSSGRFSSGASALGGFWRSVIRVRSLEPRPCARPPSHPAVPPPTLRRPPPTPRIAHDRHASVAHHVEGADAAPEPDPRLFARFLFENSKPDRLRVARIDRIQELDDAGARDRQIVTLDGFGGLRWAELGVDLAL